MLVSEHLFPKRWLDVLYSLFIIKMSSISFFYYWEDVVAFSSSTHNFLNNIGHKNDEKCIQRQTGNKVDGQGGLHLEIY